MHELTLRENGSEILEYDHADFPVRARNGSLSIFANYAAACHWHRDFEILRAIGGEMDYFVNGDRIHLASGQAVFVNSGRLHYGYSEAYKDCNYRFVVYHPMLLGAHTPIGVIVERLIAQSNRDWWLLDENTPESARALECMENIYQASIEDDALSALSYSAMLTQIIYKMSDVSNIAANDSGLLRNEIDMPETEVAALQLVGKTDLIRVPKVYYHDFSQTVCSGKFFFMEAFEGNSFVSIAYMLGEDVIASVYRKAGEIIKTLAQIKSDRFGSLVSAEYQYDTLFELIFKMISNVLEDAADKNIDLGVSKIEILDKLTSEKSIFDEVTESTLIHEDMWEGNVFVKDGEVIGIIDWERAMWGEPLMEEYFRSHHHVDAFYEGYGRNEFTENEQRRIYWYDLFLFLTMLTEPEYRDYEDKGFNDWVLPSMKTTCEKLMINYRR